MSTAVRVAVAGFTPFERDNFDSFFRLSARRTPSYVLADDLARCDLAVVDGDCAAVTAEVHRLGLLARTLLIGGTPLAGVAAQLPRPINLALVVRALNEVVRRTNPMSRSVQRVLDDLATVTGRAQAAHAPPPLPGTPAPGADRDLLLRGEPADAGIPVPPQRRGMDNVLVVDRSDDTLRLLAAQLERFGFQVHLARTGLQALDSVSQRHFEFVFLDADLVDVDAYLTCQAIKRNTSREQRTAPTMVMLVRRDSDRLRSILAGSDACLVKPLREDELLRVVGGRDVARNAYAETSGAARTQF